MRKVSSLLFLGLALCATPALADRNDLRLFQLGNPGAGMGASASANDNFRIFARELSAAISSVNLGPPETLGHAAFAVNAELSVVNLDTTQFNLPTEKPFDGPWLIPSVHVRKGLPWSFELGGRIAWLDQSRMAAGTLEAKWALNEGFTYLPDLGVRGSVTKLVNARDMDLTSSGLDIGIGKQFAVGGMITLTPYVGWNLVWTAATTDTVDFNRTRSHAESISTPTAQLSDTGVFEDVKMGSNSHNRFYGGLRFIGGVVTLGVEYSYAQVGTIEVVDVNTPAAKVNKELPAVTAYNVTLGLDF